MLNFVHVLVNAWTSDCDDSSIMTCNTCFDLNVMRRPALILKEHKPKLVLCSLRQLGKAIDPKCGNRILLRDVDLSDRVRKLRIDNHGRWHFCQPCMVNVVMDIADQLSRAAFIVTADLSTDEAEIIDQISPTKFDLFRRIKALNEDETAVLAEVLNFALEGLERGRHRYGPLVLETDNRDFLQEAREELRDGGIYLAAAKLKVNRDPSGI